MSKKIVIKADLVGKACMRDILSVAATLQGIKSMDVDDGKSTLTVIGTVDPVRIARKLKKKCFAVTILSVEDDKPKPKPPAQPSTSEKKDPGKEACEKLCKEKCEKMACCKECKDKCKETCERRCKAWLERGNCCSCSTCKPSPPPARCCCTRCAAVPSYNPYSYCGYPYSGCSRGSWPWP